MNNMCTLKSFVITCLLCSITIAKTVKEKDSIGFPEVEENLSQANKDNRQPVYIPAMCPENELYYPGDQKDDWICDCRPAFLYHPKSDACWPAYRKGPCQDGYYLVMTPDSAIPVCEKNPCSTDSFVPFNGRCEQLSTGVACRHLWPIPATLEVNATTLAVKCATITVPSRFNEELTVPPVQCPPGCKRSVKGACVPMIAT